MIATCLAFFILPCLLVMSLMVARAHSQLRSANETYYYEVTDSFSRAVLVQLSDFRQWTYRVSLDSRSRKNDAAKLALNEDSTGYARPSSIIARRTACCPPRPSCPPR